MERAVLSKKPSSSTEFNTHVDRISCIAVKDNTVVVGSYDRSISVWELEPTVKMIRRFRSYSILQLDFSKQHNYICASSTINTSVTLYNLHSGRVTNHLAGAHKTLIGELVCCNNLVLSISSDCTAAIWNAVNGHLITEVCDMGMQGPVSGVWLDDDIIVMFHNPNIVKLMQLVNDKLDTLQTIHLESDSGRLRTVGGDQLFVFQNQQVTALHLHNKKLQIAATVRGDVSIYSPACVYQNWIFYASSTPASIKILSTQNRMSLIPTSTTITTIAVSNTHIVTGGPEGQLLFTKF